MHIPISIYSLFNQSQKSTKVTLPRVTLDITNNNFVFKSCSLWNSLIGDVLERSIAGTNGTVVERFCIELRFEFPRTIYKKTH